MIVVTGPGRSGTSLVAKLYRELGLDPGGAWDESTRGGLEDREVVAANIAIIRDLGIAAPARHFGLMTHLGIPQPLERTIKRVVPSGWHRRIRSLVKEPPWVPWRSAKLVDWSRVVPTAGRHAEALRDLAAGRPAAKDPRFCWTLPVWVAAGGPIEHVVVCVRSMEAMLDSRIQVGWLERRSRGVAHNWFAYGLGICLAAINDARLSHAVIRFPDFLDQPDELFAAMRLPEAVTRERFLEVLAKEIRPELVRDSR